MEAPLLAQALLETLNKMHVYCKIMRILMGLQQLFTGSDSHDVCLKCSSLASAQKEGFKGIREDLSFLM
jgi:hypothetical protein